MAPFFSGNVSVPIKLLFEAEGMKITVEVSIVTDFAATSDVSRRDVYHTGIHRGLW